MASWARVAVIATGQRRAAALATACRYGGEIVEVMSAESLRDVARDGRINLVVAGEVGDLGPTPAAALRMLATLAVANVKLVVDAEGITPENGELLLRVAATLVERQRLAHLERARSGRARAQGRGVEFGRPPKVVDVDRARELLNQPRPLRQVARILGVSPRCLRRHLGQLDPTSAWA